MPVKFELFEWKVDEVLQGPNLEDITGGRFERKLDIKLGLDLQGGTYIVLRGDMSQVTESERGDKINATKEILKNRVDQFGISESNLFTSVVGDEYRIIVELPGSGEDVETQIDTLKTTAKLEFKEERSQEEIIAITDNFTNLPQDGDFTSIYFRETGVSGADLKTARSQLSQQSGQNYDILLEFTNEGAQKFKEAAIRNRGKTIAIILDGQVISNPSVSSDYGLVSGDDRFVNITGEFTQEEASNLAIQLRGGALPIPVEVIEQKTVEPTLGRESLILSLIGGVVGVVLLMLFMIYLYKWNGVIADVALIIYILINVAVYKWVPITLSLAGIAGFILSIGVAVDANILIFERMLEELRKGRSRARAVYLGFQRAWLSIRDSNASTLITCAILFYFGSTAVKAFALNLAIGVVVSLFTAITVTKTLLNTFMRRN